MAAFGLMTTSPGITLFRTAMPSVQPMRPSSPTATERRLAKDDKAVQVCTTPASENGIAGLPTDVEIDRAAATIPITFPSSLRWSDAL